MLLWTAITVISLSYSVDAFCFMARPKISPDPALENLILDCQHNNHTIPKGTKWRDYDTCVDCGCALDGTMHCCGFSYNAGVFFVDGCKMVKLEHCEFKFVDEKDETQACSNGILG